MQPFSKDFGRVDVVLTIASIPNVVSWQLSSLESEGLGMFVGLLTLSIRVGGRSPITGQVQGLPRSFPIWVTYRSEASTPVFGSG